MCWFICGALAPRPGFAGRGVGVRGFLLFDTVKKFDSGTKFDTVKKFDSGTKFGRTKKENLSVFFDGFYNFGEIP
jgi:hypothetical protein